MSLDARMAGLLGDAPSIDETPAEHECPIFLEMTPESARVVVEGLRWALYGGTPPPDARRSLLIVLDALTLGLAS